MGIVMIPAIVLTYFCFEPQSGKRVKKRAQRVPAYCWKKLRIHGVSHFFAFFFQMAVAFEGSFLTYYMADIQIDTVNLGLILFVRAMMEIPFLFFIGRLRRHIKMKYLIMLSANFDGDGVSVLLLPCEFAADYVGICRVLRPWQRCISRHGHELYL